MLWPLQISDYLNGKVEVGTNVELRGWVRTRRDSKAGFSFINLHDGSSFDGIQVVADKALANYESDVLKLGAGCSIAVQGTLVESQGKEQSVELQANQIEVLGWVDDPETYPVAKNAIRLNTCAPRRTCAPEPIPLAPLPAFATAPPRPFIAIFMNVIFIG